MAISFRCPACGERQQAPDDLAGRSSSCPDCGRWVTIPGSAVGAGTAEPDRPPAPRPTPGADSVRFSCPACGRRQRVPYFMAGQYAPCPGCAANVLIPPLGNDPDSVGSEEAASSLRGQGDRAIAPWQRHLHWLLLLALFPLAYSLQVDEGRSRTPEARFLIEVAEAAPEIQKRLYMEVARQKMEGGMFIDLIAALPAGKLKEALLPPRSRLHWLVGAGSGLLFGAFLLGVWTKGAAPRLHLLLAGLYGAVAALVLLFLVQMISHTSPIQLNGVRGRLMRLVIVLINFIGFSFRGAFDPDNDFLLSFLGFTLGVGLCEEVVKALPVLVAPHGREKASWRTGFFLGLASGAGFGVMESVLYAGNFDNGVSGPTTYLIRFLSSVALQAVWTGSVAVALSYWEEKPPEAFDSPAFLVPLGLMLGAPLVLHGLYDTSLKKGMYEDALVFAVLSFVYLGSLLVLRHAQEWKLVRAAS